MMRNHSRHWTGNRAAGAALLLTLAVSACGDGDPDASNADTDLIATEATSETGASQDDVDDGAASAELHPALADFPLPPGYEVPFPADEYDADVDERELVVQLVLVQLPDDEVARFLLAELPAAGFDIVDRGSGWLVTEDDIEPGAGSMIYFEGPDPVAGQITIQPQGEQTAMNINFYRAGDFSDS